MSSIDLVTDAFGRVQGLVHRVVGGLSAEQLAYRVDAEANSIAWLVWHLTRVQDDHMADAAGTQQVWTSQGWVERFGLPFDRRATGYGHSSDEVAAVRAEADLLAGYHDATHAQTIEYVKGLGDDDLAQVVDRAWNPPVTLGVRLVSVISDSLQHAGQAGFIRGIVLRQG